MARRALLAAITAALLVFPVAATAQDPGTGGSGVPNPAPTGGADLKTPLPTGAAEIPPPVPPAPVAQAPEAPAPPVARAAKKKRVQSAGQDEEVEADVPVPDEEEPAARPQASAPSGAFGLASTGFAVAFLGFAGLVLGVAGISLRRAARSAL